MKNLSESQSASRERTLLAAMLLSLPAPLVTGIAVLSSTSTTQLADFIRRSVELAALCVSWWTFRRLRRDSGLSEPAQARLERRAGLCVAAAMLASGLAMLGLALSRLSRFEPGGDVFFGLGIASAGLLVNALFWRRYTLQTRERFSAVISSQRDLYRAKVLVDLCVVVALATVAVAPAHRATRFVDVLGSFIVALYLLRSGLRSARTNRSRPGESVAGTPGARRPEA